MTDVLLQVDGEVERPLQLSLNDFRAFEPSDQVEDVNRLDPRRHGDGVQLNAILEQAEPKPTATHLTLHASIDGFAASIPLDSIRERGIVVYQLHGEALPASKGGPIRFFIRDSQSCRTAELDDCANVKFIDRIELSATKGRDTRD